MSREILFWLCNEDDLVDSELSDNEVVEVKVDPEVMLFRLEEGDFQVVRTGSYKTILSGSDYLLIRRDIAYFIAELLPYEVEVRDIRIVRKTSNEVNNMYAEIIIQKEIKFGDYYNFRVEGFEIYAMFNSMIYVSLEVRDRIIQQFPSLIGIEFKRGLPILGG